VRSFLNDSSHFTAVLKVADRFSDLGLVAFVHVAGSQIVDFVMSCRAMNRKLEFNLISFVEQELKKRGVERITSKWKRTPKNAPVKDLYERMGFQLLSESEEEKYYERILG
jgi:predicted enzyme involved in methoxymalonyl-ACP biosynthesis